MEITEPVSWLAVKAAVTLVGLFVARSITQWLYRGYKIRKQVKDVAAQGIAILPHSWLLGHLTFIGDYRRTHPKDANIFTMYTWILDNFETLFPGEKTVPPVIYLDVWPITSSALIVSTHPAVSAQFTQIQSLPKAKIGRDFLKPLTNNRDIVSTEGDEWKTWRTRLNPGFSSRNVAALLPELVEEVLVFVDELRKLSGNNGAWGPVFQLEEKTTNLTFDVIARATIDTRLHEQTRKTGSPLKTALLDQAEQMGKAANASRGIIHAFTPWASSSIGMNNKAMYDFFMPKVQDRLASGSQSSRKRTIVDLALKHFDEEDGQGTLPPDAEFLDKLLSNLKAFVFAGHDTTATTICWMFKCLQDHPDCLAKMREEHASVLGPDTEKAHEVILAASHLLYALPYTQAVIKETLRLYPLVAALRDGSPEFFLTAPGSSFRYPTDGFSMWDGVSIIQRRPDLWPRGKEFIPERWLVPEGDPMRPLRDTWRPFAMGLRNCIGQELAMAELRLVAVLTARKFDVQEAWAEWDMKQGNIGHQPTIDGERLYRVGNGPVHPKDSMPVHVRLRT
ncbi:hypothetical protein JX266_004868 [Neoarthrinium moseri]|nr:hypothetical protein JX266_004868 [Neoarthrinium moseri]